MPLSNDKATERFVLALETILCHRISDVRAVRLEYAFNDAVDARVEKALAEARRD